MAGLIHQGTQQSTAGNSRYKYWTGFTFLYNKKLKIKKSWPHNWILHSQISLGASYWEEPTNVIKVINMNSTVKSYRKIVSFGSSDVITQSGQYIHNRKYMGNKRSFWGNFFVLRDFLLFFISIYWKPMLFPF